MYKLDEDDHVIDHNGIMSADGHHEVVNDNYTADNLPEDSGIGVGLAENTAVIFISDNIPAMVDGKKINYYSHVLKQID